MRPIRIQRKRTKGWKMPANTVYVGRPTIWGNPFIIGEKDLVGFGTISVDKYMAVRRFKDLMTDKRVNGKAFKKIIRQELRGKNLACWCNLSEECHADVLLKIANNL